MQISDNLHAFLWNSSAINNCNTYLIDGATRVLIDPGHLNLFEHVQKGLTILGMEIPDIGLVINTHAHPDHIEAVQLFNKKEGLTAISEEEWRFVKEMRDFIDSVFGINIDAIAPKFFLQEGDLVVNGLELKVFHTPGHSPGSLSVYSPKQKVLFTGDLIFKNGIGRTDLPGGNSTLLKKSVERLRELEIEILLPGHGEIISGAKEIRANFDTIERFWFPFL
ncbi:MAG: MBL fold metallo-hydrolase [Thermodesulfobacteriota bacterium]|jgi:glyoxylase-like metal-dependent hydrolase (beta-lactamase superfamily II)|nr:MAG: MBL fold metallo-hydrolase [Thermodesulfobacteriota bacterium]